MVSHSYADNNGVLAQTNYPNGTTVNYTYDTLERVTETRYNNSVAAEYAYDANGELGAVTDRRAGRFYSYAYDSLGRLVQAIQYSGTNVGGTALTDASYQYDAAGRLAQESLAINPYVMELAGSGSRSTLSLQLDNTYATDGTLSATQIRAATRVVTPQGFPSQNVIGQNVVSQQSVQLKYGYDELRRPMSVELSPGGLGRSLMTVKYAYLSGSAAERTTPLIASLNTSVKGHRAVTLEYSYDALGNITQISGHTLSGSDTASYRYDAQSQLTRETLSDRSYAYTYDTAGNILSKKETRGGTTTTHTYTYGNSQWKDLLTKYDGVTVTYDAIGNPLKYRGMTFTWGNGRELRSAKAGGAYMLYTYGADGLRTQKIVGTNEIHSYGWSGGRLVYERMGTSAYSTMGTGSTQGTQGAQKVLTPPAASAYDRTLYFLYDASGSPIGFILREGSGLPKTYYYVKNLQGDVLGIIDGGGNVKAAYRYNAWGEILCATGELAELNPLRYRGYYYDSETGLYYLQSRYYDPVVGRFLNADNAFDQNAGMAGYNLFVYCANNPVIFKDNNGESIILVCIIAGAVIGAVAGGYIGAQISEAQTGEINTWAIVGGAAGGAVLGGLAGYGVGYGITVLTASSGGTFSGLAIASENAVPQLTKTGQFHHVLSNPIIKALDNHPTLYGLFNRADSVVQALTPEAHRGYQQWHRLIDNSMVNWIRLNPTATPNEFWNELYSLYNTPEMIERFGNGVLDFIRSMIK